MRLKEINTVKEHFKFVKRYAPCLVFILRPRKSALFKAFLPETKTGLVPVEYFKPCPVGAAEDKKVF
jgi:hypothetical protein